MKFNERFIAGRIKRRVLRAPVIDGWLCDEQELKAPERTQLALKKHGAEELVVPIPDAVDLAKLGPTASALVRAEEGLEILVGWPEKLIIVRRGGTVIYAEGDVVHFGRLQLDREHAVERTGYEYLNETGAEVRVELTTTTGDASTRAMLDPGGITRVGPYEIEHDHSYDPSDRATGAPHHGYFFRVRRRDSAAVSERPGDVPHPLDVADPLAVIGLARSRDLLGANEAMFAETEVFANLLARYEGPRQTLEAALRDIGPTPPALTRRGEVLVVQGSHVTRGEHGEARYGRATISLDPTGTITVSRNDRDTVPGRLRKRSSS